MLNFSFIQSLDYILYERDYGHDKIVFSSLVIYQISHLSWWLERTKHMENAKILWDINDLLEQGFSRTKAYQLLNNPQMPLVQIGKRKYLHRELFEAWIKEQAQDGQKNADRI